MSRRKRGSSPRFRVAKVSVYWHHGAWWLYYRDGGRPVRRKVAEERSEAEQVAAQWLRGYLTWRVPTPLTKAVLRVPGLALGCTACPPSRLSRPHTAGELMRCFP
jgi:hypothetical protein